MNLSIDKFLALNSPIFDVRSPSEYNQGHIPGAISLPMFSDEERRLVGISYKHEGKEVATLLGLSFIESRLLNFVHQVKQHIQPPAPIRIYCWRGGMRSLAISQLMHIVGFSCIRLQHGYKDFRRWVLKTFEKPWELCILGGYTGSGKTIVLKGFKKAGEQVIDLEELAKHKGSCFGNLEGQKQPSVEHFENLIATEFLKFNLEKPVWLEDESRMIGHCKIPDALFNSMRRAPLFVLDIPFQERIQNLVGTYASYSPEIFIKALDPLKKRLGSERVKEITTLLAQNNPAKIIEILLKYYDSSYDHCIQQRSQVIATALPIHNVLDLVRRDKKSRTEP